MGGAWVWHGAGTQVHGLLQATRLVGHWPGLLSVFQQVPPASSEKAPSNSPYVETTAGPGGPVSRIRPVGNSMLRQATTVKVLAQDAAVGHLEEQSLKAKSEKDFWSGLLFVLVGAGFAWGALTYSFGSSARPGPAYFPFGLGILLAVLGAAILFKALTTKVKGGDQIGPWPLKQAGMILLAVVLFGALLPKLGMVVALPVLIGVSSLASGEFRIKEVLANSVVLTAFSWLIFIKGLGLTIPLWPAFVTA